jgi:polyisoprenyl-teichoic acid--peptidoglycan teichoic acid transferase
MRTGDPEESSADQEPASQTGGSFGVTTGRPTTDRSRLGAAVLSFLWPGLGQLYSRRPFAAAVFAVPVVLAAIWLGLQLANGLGYFGASFLDDSFALTFAIGLVLLGLWRMASMIHAYAVAGPRRRPSRVDTGVIAILLVTVVAVHAFAANLALAAYNFDNNVASNQLIPDQPTLAPTGLANASATAGPSPTAAWTPTSTGSPEPTWSPSPTPAPSHRITVLLTGVDFLAGRRHAMNDSILIASVDTQTYQAAILSVPRDTSNFDFYWGGSAGINTKINNFANLVAQGAIHAPDPPATALAKEVGWLVGLKVDYYVIVDIAGFGALVDAANGVCVNNPKAINDPSTDTFIPAGNQCMDGATTLKYVRSREGAGDNDYTRSGRQQDVLIALARKLTSAAGIGYLANVLAVAGKEVQTNFPLKTARDYVSLAGHVAATTISQCVLGPPYNYHPSSALTKGTWTSRLKLSMVAGLSVYLFGADSRFYGMEGITPAPCA